MTARLYISHFSIWYEASQQQQWKNILQTECHTSCTLHKYMSNHKYLYGNDCIMGVLLAWFPETQHPNNYTLEIIHNGYQTLCKLPDLGESFDGKKQIWNTWSTMYANLVQNKLAIN